MPANQRASCLVQHFNSTRHHLIDDILNLGLDAVRHRGNGRGTLGFGAHGKDVTEAMIGRHLAKDVGVVNERTEEIHGVNHGFAGRHRQNGGVVRGVKADQDIVPLDGFQLSQGTRKNGAAHLGATTTTTHGNRRNGLGGFLGILCGSRIRQFGFFLHWRQIVELLHEAAIDPVFPAPDPGAVELQISPGGHSVLVPGAD